MKNIFRIFLVAVACFAMPAFSYDASVVEDTLKSQEGIAGLKRHEIVIDGQKIFYLDNERTQAGRTIMLVHGFGDSGLSWNFFARIFRDGDYRVIIPDLLGFGRSARVANADYGFAAQSKRLITLLNTLKVSSAHLVGNSMGGGIVAKMAIEQPLLVASLTLIDAAGVHYKTTELDENLLAGNNLLLVKNAQDFERLIDFVSVERPAMPRPVLEYLAERAVKDNAQNAKIFNLLFKDVNFLLLDLDKIKAPTFIVWGEKDRVLNPENAKVFKKFIANSQVFIVPNVGHVPMIEAPEVTALAVNKFIDALYAKP